MAPRPTRHLSPGEIKADREALLALKNIRDYAPANPAYSAAAAACSRAASSSFSARILACSACSSASPSAASAAALALHEALMGVKAQVLAQYGSDSFEIQALGLKRKSDHKRRTRRTVPVS